MSVSKTSWFKELEQRKSSPDADKGSSIVGPPLEASQIEKLGAVLSTTRPPDRPMAEATNGIHS